MWLNDIHESEAKNFHVVPDPDSDGWLVIEMTDQEAFEWDREHHGESIAVLNWQEMQKEYLLRIDVGGEG